MSLVRITTASVIVLSMSSFADAQEDAGQGGDRFFFDALEADESLDETGYDGSFTSTTVYHQESSGAGIPFQEGATAADNASPVSRFFTDLRAQFEADHISGGRWDFRTDIRGRFVPGSCDSVEGSPNGDPCTRFQAGTFGAHELEVRELYIRRGGDTNDFSFGRQFVLELGATKFDGIKYERGSGQWKLIAFGGGYPQRISRDIREDYPEVSDGADGKRRVFAVTGGAGAAYRFERYYGAFGGVAVVPLSNQVGPGNMGQLGKEQPRFFLTSNGYWRLGSTLDIYHNAIVDVTGSAAIALTNLTVGVNFQPSPRLRTYAQLTQVDTETLNITAQSQLEDAGGNTNAVQNHIEVRRIASASARAGVSGNFLNNRLGVSASLTLRRRPAINLLAGMTPVPIESAEATDVTLKAVDRRSLFGTRVAGTLTQTLGGILGGGNNLDRSRNTIVQLEAQKEFKGGRALLDGSVSYIGSTDINRADVNCDPIQLETCYGNATSQTFMLGLTGYYQFGSDWFAYAGANLGLQFLSSVRGAAPALEEVSQPSILMTTLFTRIAYKF